MLMLLMVVLLCSGRLESMDKFIFLHILKCAGTTIRFNLLNQHFKNKYIYDANFKIKHYKDYKGIHPFIIENQKYPNNYEKYDIIFGHFKYDKYLHLDRPYITFIRDPIKRIISQYYYHIGYYKRNGMDLDIVELAELMKNHMSYVLGDDLSIYKYIGIVEDFDRSLAELCNILKIKHNKRIIKQRVRKNTITENIPINVIQKLKQINKVDIQLYEYIKNRRI